MSETDEYYNLFMKQFIQTLAQLSAVLVTSTLAVPAYTYYTRRNLVNNQTNTYPYNEDFVHNTFENFKNEVDTEIDDDDDTSLENVNSTSS